MNNFITEKTPEYYINHYEEFKSDLLGMVIERLTDSGLYEEMVKQNINIETELFQSYDCLSLVIKFKCYDDEFFDDDYYINFRINLDDNLIKLGIDYYDDITNMSSRHIKKIVSYIQNSVITYAISENLY